MLLPNARWTMYACYSSNGYNDNTALILMIKELVMQVYYSDTYFPIVNCLVLTASILFHITYIATRQPSNQPCKTQAAAKLITIYADDCAYPIKAGMA